MDYKLPQSLVNVLKRTPVLSVAKLSPDREWLYTALTPEHFNAIVEDRVTALCAQYGFNAPEHSDWVDTTRVYIGREMEGLDPFLGTIANRPLNSWVLKDPIIYVPSISKMKELVEHIRSMAENETKQNLVPPTSECINESFVKLACKQIRDLKSLLSAWRESQSPKEQVECHNASHSQIKDMLSEQGKNLLASKKKYDLFEKLKYPEFFLDIFGYKVVQDRLVLEQLRQIA